MTIIEWLKLAKVAVDERNRNKYINKAIVLVEKLEQQLAERNEKLFEIIRMYVTKYIALSLERHLDNHGITQCTILLDIRACLNSIYQEIHEAQEGEK